MQINPKGVPEPVGPYSQGFYINGLLFISGQVPIKADGELVEGNIEEKTKRVIENISAILSGAGMEIGDVVKTTIYLKNISDFDRVNEVYARYFGKTRPARVCVEVSNLPKNAEIEMEAIAYKEFFNATSAISDLRMAREAEIDRGMKEIEAMEPIRLKAEAKK